MRFDDFDYDDWAMQERSARLPEANMHPDMDDVGYYEEQEGLARYHAQRYLEEGDEDDLEALDRLDVSEDSLRDWLEEDRFADPDEDIEPWRPPRRGRRRRLPWGRKRGRRFAGIPFSEQCFGVAWAF